MKFKANTKNQLISLHFRISCENTRKSARTVI